VCAAHATSHEQVEALQLAVSVYHDHHANVVGEDVHAVVTWRAATTVQSSECKHWLAAADRAAAAAEHHANVVGKGVHAVVT
jgi:hypothetical protein